MTKPDSDWNLYRSFLAVMREGSLSGAARVLGMTQPSLGRHIRELEAALDVALFTRSPQGLTPTDLARELLPHAEAMATASSALQRASQTRPGRISGVVRISASEVVGAELLPDILTRFHTHYPDVRVELVLTNRRTNLLRKEADIAVRMVRPTQLALVAHRAGQIPLGIYAHQDYIARRGQPTVPADLSRHSLIGFDQEQPYIRRLRPFSLPYRREDFSLRTDSDLAALAALRAGFGIGLCQVGIASRDSDLMRLFPEFSLPSLEAWVVTHEDLRSNPPVRALFDHLYAALKEYCETIPKTG